MKTKKEIISKMEAPSPKTPVPFLIKYRENDEPYSIRFSVESDSLVINVSEDETTPMINYSFKYSISDLGKINKYFKMFDSFEELMPELKGLCEDKENKISIQKNKGSIILTLFVPLQNDRETHLTIPQAEMDDHQVTVDLCSTVNELKKKIKLLEANQIPEEQLKKNLKSKEILLNDGEKKMVSNWILKTMKSKGKNINMTLLYKATVNGDGCSNFHNCCNNQGYTLTLIRNTKGFRCGGFTTQKWQSNNCCMKDPNAFLFSLDYKEYYPSYDGENAIYDHQSYGPCFGSTNDLCISNGCRSNNSSCNFPTYYCGTRYRSLTGGVSNFKVDELEVYKIEIA